MDVVVAGTRNAVNMIEVGAREIDENSSGVVSMEYDVFICHASEDKTAVVNPLVNALSEAGVRVWHDADKIAWGDSVTDAGYLPDPPKQRWQEQFAKGAAHPVIGASERELNSIKVPTCIIPGNDRTHNHAVAETAHRMIPGSELHDLFPGDL